MITKRISLKQLHPIAKAGSIDDGPARIHASPFTLSGKDDNVIVARVLTMEGRQVFQRPS